MNALKTFGRSRRFWLAGATMVAVAIFGVVAVTTSGAAGPCPIPGNFEIDGNMSQQTCTPGADDWNTPNIGVAGTNQGGTYSTAGKDNSDPSTWTSSGSTPDKTDFSQAYATSRTVDVGGSPHFFVFVAWERTSTTGTQGYAIELTNSGANVAADGTPQPNRSNGGSVFYISAQGASSPTFDGSCTYTSQSDYGSTCSNSSAGFYSAFNSAAFTDPLSGQSIAAGGFYEVALDVTALTGIVPSCPGATAATVYLRSITGQTKNGNLKGYMAPLEVSPDSTCVPPPISTTATPGGSEVALGTSQHDTVSVGNPPTTPAGVGTVTFFLCAPSEVTANGGDCSKNGTQVGSAVTLDANGQQSSSSVTASATGKYCWRAEFTPGANDHNYLPGSETNSLATGAAGDECFIVVPNQPSLTTQLSADSILNSDSVTDTASLTGATSDASGAITISVYSGSDANACVAGNLVDHKLASPATSGNSDYSATFSGLAAGSYEFQASIAADAKNKSAVSACGTEPLTVMNQPSLTTQLSADSILNSDSVTDTASLTGATSDASGAITISVYSGSDANACVAGNLVDHKLASPATSGNSDYSATFSGLAAGSYEFQASIAADAKNKSAVSACGTEPLTVQTQPAVTTVADPASAVVGADELKTASDTATFTNGHQLADQDVSFALFAKPDCTGATGIGGTVKIANDGQTATFTGDASALPAGTYYWYVSYAGDKYNKPVQECGGDTGVKNETLTLGAHAPKVTTVADPASAVIGADALKAASDTATFTDGYQLAGQDVSFALFAKPDCTGATGVGGTVKIANDGQTATFTGDASGLSAGTYYWYVSYGGDINNNPVQECGGDRGVENETLTIQKAQPTVTTTQDPASGSVGDTFKDKATLSGSVNQDGTGTITFNLYENPSCLEDPIYTETVPVSADGTYETPNGVKLDTPGAYYWVASFSGDSNNLPATSGCADEKVVVKPAEIHIVKTPDAAKVDVGSSIGFTLTVYNAGDGDAHGVTLSDTLPTNPGLSWTIASQGAGWAGSCAIAAGVLSCGPVTVPGGTTQAASAYTVHIKSSTTAATGGDCPGSGTVNNTGDVTSTNAGSDEASASTCVQALVDLSVTKAGSPATQILGTGNITWTIVVKNNGPDADTGVTITDPMPAGNSFVSATTTKGSCTGGAILTCNIGNMAAGETVTITLVTTPSTTGAQVNTVTASGNRPETNTGNNQASATVQVTPQVFPPPVVYCVAVSNVTPKQLFVGRKTTLTIHVTQHGKAKAGVKVLIRAPKLLLRTKRSNAKGIIKQHVKMKKAGAMIFTPIASKRCNTKRIGITNVFTPPVTG